MRISANFTTDDLAALKFENEADWIKAVEMFHDRLKTRYIDHIETIIRKPTSGFAVLSFDCVLIEALQQFRLGERETPYGKGKKRFVDFLTKLFSTITSIQRWPGVSISRYAAAYFIKPRAKGTRV